LRRWEVQVEVRSGRFTTVELAFFWYRDFHGSAVS
jgi:hypothetical protein